LLLLHYDDLNRHVSSRISKNLQGLVRADDILQMTFVRAAHAITSFRQQHDGAFRGWLRTIANNLVRDAEKRRRRERRLPALPKNLIGPRSSVAMLDGMIAAQTTPGRKVQRRENVRRLQAALAGLPDDQREVVQRRYLRGQTLEQIAEATGRTKGAVRSICYRARKNLRNRMGRSSLYFSG
jgi:RNA polymerase sigma-70 factor (ECF subfamily)